MVFMAGRPGGIINEAAIVLTCSHCGDIATYSPEMDKRCQKCGHRFNGRQR